MAEQILAGKVGLVFGVANKRSIAWQVRGTDRELSKPIESLGWTMERDGASISSLLRGVSSSEYYMTYLVYPDSFDVFRAIRDQAVAAKFDIGMEIMGADSDIFWGTNGSIPPPL